MTARDLISFCSFGYVIRAQSNGDGILWSRGRRCSRELSYQKEGRGETVDQMGGHGGEEREGDRACTGMARTHRYVIFLLNVQLRTCLER